MVATHGAHRRGRHRRARRTPDRDATERRGRLPPPRGRRARQLASLDGVDRAARRPVRTSSRSVRTERARRVNDPFGLHPLYLGEFGSSPGARERRRARRGGARIAERPRRPNPTRTRSRGSCSTGRCSATRPRTAVCGRLPFGSACASFGPMARLTVVPWHEPPWHRTDAPRTPHTHDVGRCRRAADDRDDRARRSPRRPRRGLSELTAGRDSRLVLELTARAGVADRVLFRTYGPRDSPDGAAAAEIARQLGLSYDDRDLAARCPAAPTLENFVAHVRQVSAQIPCWEMSAPRRRPTASCSPASPARVSRTNYPTMRGPDDGRTMPRPPSPVTGSGAITTCVTACSTSCSSGRGDSSRRRSSRARRPRTSSTSSTCSTGCDAGSATSRTGSCGTCSRSTRPPRCGRRWRSGWEARAQACVPRGGRPACTALRSRTSSFEQGTRWRDARRPANSLEQEAVQPAPRPALDPRRCHRAAEAGDP